MNRLKLLATVALLGLPLAACEESTPPPPVGSIAGTVTIEGTGIDGVSVDLSNGSSTATSGGGSFRFDNVEGGAYTVTISGYPSDATFDATSAAATISADGQSATVNFTGAYIRTAGIMGSVTVENAGLAGVTVTLSGVSNATATTDASGQYAFTGLRQGNYSVEVSGFDSDEIGFSATASAVAVGVGESKVVSFDGTYLRTAGIQGQVSVDGEGLEGVTVSLTGGPDAVSETRTTDAGGQYSFAKLRAGDYAVAISGYDTKDYEFEVTSRSVTVALGETATVPFEGTLLRTAGISGRVFVAGVGHPDVTVTLSGGDLEADVTTTTDDAGVYAFSGLAAGTYTVAISGYDDNAYVFDKTSEEVTVADDQAAIQNFEGSHATTASISGMLYVDEGTNNDKMDEDETPFAVAVVPVTLVGPGVHDLTPGATDEMGRFMFSELRAGSYQLVVQIPDAVAALMPDYAYGGPSEGYAVALDVGEKATQNIPMDITHQTVNFSVTLRSGDKAGDPLPGATVTFYEDPRGEYRIADDSTDADGMAAIRFERTRGEDGNAVSTVYASVAAPSDDYHADGDMQAVTWDPKLPTNDDSNAGDIVSLKADVTFAGRTITTERGGGEALAGWAIDVMLGEGADAETLEGDDVPEELDEDGTAAFTATVAADDLPVTYTFALADDQDDKLDGGETVETDGPIEYVHDGLSVVGTTGLDTLEAMYTTQTLKVYVHHDRDQVAGYTGSVLGEDERKSGMVALSVRYFDGSDEHRDFDEKEWVQSKNMKDDGNGGYTFTGVPTARNIVVEARKAADSLDIIVLGTKAHYGHNDEIHAYRDFHENGVEGGAFGAQGGYSSTVELCPLKAVDPSNQFHGECGSFAYVETYGVSGTVTKRVVEKANKGAADQDFVGADNFDPATPLSRAAEVTDSMVSGQKVTMTPVVGRHLARGDGGDFTTAKADDSKTKGVNETWQFDFGKLAEGHYAVGVPDNWEANATAGATTGLIAKEYHHERKASVIEVTPRTGYLYGKVWAEKSETGFGVADVVVTVNGQSDTTDVYGRYIVEGFHADAKAAAKDGGDGEYAYEKGDAVATVEFAAEGVKPVKATVKFIKNDPIRFNQQVSLPGTHATISGMVTARDGTTPVAGAEILVNGEAPLNKATSGAAKGKLLTGDDGTFEATVSVSDLEQHQTTTLKVTARKARTTFVPRTRDALVGRGIDASGVIFQGWRNGTITGQVVRPGGSNSGPLQGVKIMATPAAQSSYANPDSAITGTNGRFSLSVSPQLTAYTITATKDDHTFTYPGTPASNTVPYIAEGGAVDFGAIQAHTRAVLAVAATWAKADTVTATWKTGLSAADADSVQFDVTLFTTDRGSPSSLNYGLTNNLGLDGTTIVADGVNDTSEVVFEIFDDLAPPDSVMVVAAYPTYNEDGTFNIHEGTDTLVAAIADLVPTAEITTKSDAIRGVDTTLDPDVDSISFAWTAKTNEVTEQRIVLEAEAVLQGDTARYWFVVTDWDVVHAGATFDDDYRAWNAALIPVAGNDNSVSLTLADGSNTLTVTGAALRKELRVAVEVRQEVAAGEDENKWNRSATVTIPEKK